MHAPGIGTRPPRRLLAAERADKKWRLTCSSIVVEPVSLYMSQVALSREARTAGLAVHPSGWRVPCSLLFSEARVGLQAALEGSPIVRKQLGAGRHGADGPEMAVVLAPGVGNLAVDEFLPLVGVYEPSPAGALRRLEKPQVRAPERACLSRLFLRFLRAAGAHLEP